MLLSGEGNISMVLSGEGSRCMVLSGEGYISYIVLRISQTLQCKCLGQTCTLHIYSCTHIHTYTNAHTHTRTHAARTQFHFYESHYVLYRHIHERVHTHYYTKIDTYVHACVCMCVCACMVVQVWPHLLCACVHV